MTIESPRASHSAVVGLQWGDEGKGKIVDLLTGSHDVIVRYNGGANAGHTVVVGDESYALHLIPSGILHEDKTCVIGNGVVMDPFKLVEEIDTLRDRGIAMGSNLLISDRAHVVMPYHKVFDIALEAALAETGKSIGTTGRGIGPAYADKVYRSTAIRVGDLLDADRLAARIEVVSRIRSSELAALGADSTIDVAALTEETIAIGRRLAPHITDTTYLLHDLVREGKRLLFEGANACLLDVDHGTYPFVTSSNSSTLGIPAGTGLPGSTVEHVIGIMKAYSTRVGAGAFPTELHDNIGDRIRDVGHEYGTTTGRPRRCGWLDLVATRYSAMICGTSRLACTMLDVLSGLDELKICTAYRLPDGSTTERFIPDADRLDQVEPLFETMDGWSEPICDTTDRSALPAAAQRYLDRIESFVGVPVEIVSVGPERTQTMVAQHAE